MIHTKTFSVHDPTHAAWAKKLEHFYLLWAATMFQECLREIKKEKKEQEPNFLPEGCISDLCPTTEQSDSGAEPSVKGVKEGLAMEPSTISGGLHLFEGLS